MKKIIIPAALLALVLTSCGTGPKLVEKGVFSNEQSVTLSRNWSDVTALAQHSKTKAKFLTIDGAQLNRLYISSGIGASDPLFVGSAGDSKNHVVPRGTANMSLSEQMDFVVRSLGELEYLNIESNSPKPVTIGDKKAIRFGLKMRTKQGLDIQGLAQAVSQNDKNYYIIYIAPKEHYYGANLSDAIAAMDSVVLPK